MKRKTNKNYKFGDALKAASPLFHAKYGKKGKYDKKGGNPKIRGGEVITDKNKAIAAIKECTSQEALDALYSSIVDLLNSDKDVQDEFNVKQNEFERAAVTEVVDAPVVDAPVKGAESVVEEKTPVVREEKQVEVETPEDAAVGGKKAKKSAKKGKKSAKKGGKKARKSAKKRKC